MSILEAVVCNVSLISVIEGILLPSHSVEELLVLSTAVVFSNALLAMFAERS